MIDRILVSPDGEELMVFMGDEVKVADPHESEAELVQVEHWNYALDWQEVYRRG